MNKPTVEASVKLQRILSKRVGRELSQPELDQAYDALIGFAEALMDLDTPEVGAIPQPPKKPKHKVNYPIANNKESILQYV